MDDVLDLLDALEAEEEREASSSPTSVSADLSVAAASKEAVKSDLSWGTNLLFQQMSARRPSTNLATEVPTSIQLPMSSSAAADCSMGCSAPLGAEKYRRGLSTLPAAAANQPKASALPISRAPQRAMGRNEVDTSDWFEARRIQRAKQQAAAAARERMTDRGFSADLVDSYLQHIEEALQRLVSAS